MYSIWFKVFIVYNQYMKSTVFGSVEYVDVHALKQFFDNLSIETNINNDDANKHIVTSFCYLLT